MEPPEGCPKFIDTLMRECLNIDPNLRPTFKEVLFCINRHYINVNGTL